MTEWQDDRDGLLVDNIMATLREGKEVRLAYQNSDPNTVNEVKEALGDLYRSTYGEDIQITSMVRDISGDLHVVFQCKREENE